MRQKRKWSGGICKNIVYALYKTGAISKRHSPYFGNENEQIAGGFVET